MIISSPWLSSYLSGQTKEPLVISTTGSGGTEKKVEIPAAALIASANAAHKYLGAKAGDSWSLLLPTNHIAGINVMARSILLDSELKNISERADFTSIVPTQLHKALNGDTELLKHLQGCRAVLVGGARTPDNLLEAARANQINVVTTYGATETCGGCVYNGEPLDGIKVRIETGQVEIYFPEMSGENWIKTKDLGTFLDGKLVITGRADDIIISGGENISLVRLERFLEESFPNQRFVASSVADDAWGEALVLVSDKEFPSNMRDEVQATLGKFYLPKVSKVVDEIPTIGIGKYDRKKIAELFSSYE